MRVLVVHNRYQRTGGEEVVAAGEVELLRSKGHEVRLFERTNDEIAGNWSTLAAASGTVYSFESRREVGRAVSEFRPDIMHVHNFFPLLSPSVYDAALEGGAAVVQTLHNYRLICPNGFMVRDGRGCDLCVEKQIPSPAIRYRCYRDSYAATSVVAGMLAYHRARGTWKEKVHRYIALSEHHRNLYIRGGFPADRIELKPNVYQDPGLPPAGTGRDYAVYVGRISAEKGIAPMVDAWISQQVPFRLKVAGDGPLLPSLRQMAGGTSSVELTGWLDTPEVVALFRNAKVIVMPSVINEYPMMAIEAFAAGVPLIAYENEAIRPAVESGAGWFTPERTPQSLLATVRKVWDDPPALAQASAAARAWYERWHTPERNYGLLMGIYENARREAAA